LTAASNALNVPTDNEIGAAQRYLHEVTLANSLAGMAAPAWLGPLANNFNQLTANVDQITANVNQIKGDVQLVLARQANDRIVRLNHAELERNTGVTTYQAKQKEVCSLSAISNPKFIITRL
jgi:outer membrane murein-binding lipoprotein Lpp